MSLLLLRIRKPISRVENAQVVRKLHVSFSEVERYSILFREEVQGIKGFGLRFGYRWDGRRAWEALEASK
jgi:hypothetical protein